MKTHRIINFILLVSLTVVLFAGCQASQKSPKAELKTDTAKNQAMSKRFQDSGVGDQTAVDSAIKLAQDHAALSEKMTVVQQKNQQLTEENAQLKHRISEIEPQLNQSKKELDDANKLLVEMRIELNNWKTDVIGFRDEMRQADKAQLETLLKILQILGGEVKPSSAGTSDANSKPLSNNSGGSNE